MKEVPCIFVCQHNSRIRWLDYISHTHTHTQTPSHEHTNPVAKFNRIRKKTNMNRDTHNKIPDPQTPPTTGNVPSVESDPCSVHGNWCQHQQCLDPDIRIQSIQIQTRIIVSQCMWVPQYICVTHMSLAVLVVGRAGCLN